MIHFRVLYECENFEHIVENYHIVCFCTFRFLSLIIKHSFLCAKFTFKCVCEKEQSIIDQVRVRLHSR